MDTVKKTIGFAVLVFTIVAPVLFMTGCGQKQAEIEKLKAAYIKASEDAYNKGEVNACDTFFAADFVRHNPPEPDIKGLEAYKQYILESRRIYSDFKLTINSMIMEGNTSASRYIVQATDMSTGKQVKMTGCTMHQWANGKVVEQWVHGDNLGRLQQLGFKMSPPVTANTFARVRILQFKPEKMAEVMPWYRDSFVPVIKSQKGFRGLYCLTDDKTGKSVSITLWDSEADAMAIMQAEDYKALSKEFADKFKGAMTAKDILEGYTVTVQE